MEKSNFLKEIEMMKSVSKVENELSKFVVNMLGCVIAKEPMILVLEYMEYGNLLDYLRSTRMKNHPNLKPAPYLVSFFPPFYVGFSPHLKSGHH